MRNKNSVKQLGKSKDQREALIKSQVKDLIKNGYLRTTKTRARVVSAKFDSLMAFVDVKNSKQINEYLQDWELTKEMMQLPTNGQKSGFVNLTKIKNRAGDNAEVVLVELIKNK
jgi:large subunit ribosomal protein L17